MAKFQKNSWKGKKIKNKKEIKHMKKYKPKGENILKDEFIRPEELIRWNGEKWEYKEITLDHYFHKSYKTLFLYREENLSGMQKLRLRQILKEFDYNGYMAEARVAKERFMKALDELDIEEINDVMKDCLESEHYRIQWFGGTLKRRNKQLSNYCNCSSEDFKFTNAYTESFNNQCKVAKRVSHGFRNRENYLRKLSARFTNPNSRS